MQLKYKQLCELKARLKVLQIDKKIDCLQQYVAEVEAGRGVALIRDCSDSIFKGVLLGAKHLCKDALEDCFYIVPPDKYSGTLLPKLKKFIH